MTYAVGALAIAVLGQTAAMWRLTARLSASARAEARLTHFAEALALLTDTTEAGFAQMAAGLEPHGRRRGGGSRAPVAKRIASAAREGRSVGQIAAEERISESEIRLHLGVAEQGADVALEASHGPLRI